MESCSCAIPSPANSRTLGLDIVAIISPLNGRSVLEYMDERGIAY